MNISKNALRSIKGAFFVMRCHFGSPPYLGTRFFMTMTRSKYLNKLTHLAFSQKRKMLKTSLKGINGEKILEDLNISPNLRPENLSVIDFCKIARKINSI